MSSDIQNIDIKSVLRKVRKYEIRLRKVVSGSMVGEIKSLMKGSGLEFDDVRPYHWGDDVRAIDWNVTAKGQGTYIKTFKEEKDQTVWVVFDVSGSTKNPGKEELIKEISGLIYLSALNQASNVGGLAFTDKIEWLSKPSKSKVKAMGEVTKILKVKGDSLKTSISGVISKMMAVEKKKSLVFLISDFEDVKYGESLKQLSRKHEVILINVQGEEDREVDLPLGIIPSQSAESRRLMFSFRSLFKFGESLSKAKLKRLKEFQEYNKLPNIDVFNVEVGDDYVDRLAIFFKQRNRK